MQTARQSSHNQLTAEFQILTFFGVKDLRYLLSTTTKMNNKIKQMRLPIELRQLDKNKAQHGISCAPNIEDDYTQLVATIPGPNGSPYEQAAFKVSITVASNYPFQPPAFKFLTPVYHPNIDSSGKICLDLLRMPPAGSYNPAITLESMLLSIQLLLATPNPDDPLQAEAADLYKTNRTQFDATAREYVRKHCGTSKEQAVAMEGKQAHNNEVGPKRLKLTR